MLGMRESGALWEYSESRYVSAWGWFDPHLCFKSSSCRLALPTIYKHATLFSIGFCK
jgi:hypothetical protein